MRSLHLIGILLVITITTAASFAAAGLLTSQYTFKSKGSANTNSSVVTALSGRIEDIQAAVDYLEVRGGARSTFLRVTFPSMSTRHTEWCCMVALISSEQVLTKLS